MRLIAGKVSKKENKRPWQRPTKGVMVYAVLLTLVVALLVWQGMVLFQNVKDVLAPSSSDWGLGFGAAGEQPRGNADASYLARYDAYYIGSASEKVIYLTFDAGYENGYTASILDTLKKHEVPAAFFLVSHYVNNNHDLVQRMLAEGHIVGNHTASHPNMSKISSLDAFQKELETLAADYKACTGQELPRYYRPPQGKFSEANLQHAQQLGYKTIFWSLAYADWEERTSPRVRRP